MARKSPEEIMAEWKAERASGKTATATQETAPTKKSSLSSVATNYLSGLGQDKEMALDEAIQNPAEAKKKYSGSQFGSLLKDVAAQKLSKIGGGEPSTAGVFGKIGAGLLRSSEEKQVMQPTSKVKDVELYKTQLKEQMKKNAIIGRDNTRLHDAYNKLNKAQDVFAKDEVEVQEKPLTQSAKSGLEAAGYSSPTADTEETQPQMEAAGYGEKANEIGAPIGEAAKAIGKTAIAPLYIGKKLINSIPGTIELVKLYDKIDSGQGTQQDIDRANELIGSVNTELKQGMDVVESVGRVAMPTSVVAQGAMGFTKKLAEEAGSPEGLTLGGTAKAVGTGLADAAMTAVFNKIFTAPKVKGVGTTKAKLAGLTTADINAATKGTVTPERGMEIIESAAKATEEHGSTAALENVAERSFLPTISKLEAQEAAIGKRIGEVTQAMRGKAVPQLDVAPVRDQLEQDLRALGVKFRAGKPVLTGSKIEGLGGDKLIQETWDFLSPKKGETGGAFKKMFDVYNKVGNLREKIFKGKANIELGQAERALANVRSGLKDRIVNMRGEYGGLAKGYAELDDFLTEISKATSDGVKSKEFLRKLFGNASSMSRDQLARMEGLAKQYGITEGTNVMNEAKLAIAAESAAKYEPASSLQGVIGKGVPSKSGVINQVLEMGKEKAFGTPIDNLKRLLNMPQEQITPSRIESLLSNADPELKRGLMKYLNVTSAKEAAAKSLPSKP